jgi:CubicO group peptidase (beta-lactamase class C family)
MAKGYGQRKMGESAPVDENTLFGIGSNTKAFTTAALASLVDEGKISWDDRVYERLPGFAMYDPYVSHEMTIRDLLTHRSGMGLGEGDLLFWPHSTYKREEIIYKLRFMRPAASFRSKYAYDNLLYIAAGQIIPAVTGKSWEEYVTEKILKPLGMKTTTLSNAHFPADADVARPHSKIGGPLRPIDFVELDNAAPAGSINSSVAEMSRWLMLQLNRGKFPDRDAHLFSEQRSREMWSAETILPIREREGALAKLARNLRRTIGMGPARLPGKKLVGHGRRGGICFARDAGAGGKTGRGDSDECGRYCVRCHSVSRSGRLFWKRRHGLDGVLHDAEESSQTEAEKEGQKRTAEG